jgi:hypothetical protein
LIRSDKKLGVTTEGKEASMTTPRFSTKNIDFFHSSTEPALGHSILLGQLQPFTGKLKPKVYRAALEPWCDCGRKCGIRDNTAFLGQNHSNYGAPPPNLARSTALLFHGSAPIYEYRNQRLIRLDWKLGVMVEEMWHLQQHHVSPPKTSNSVTHPPSQNWDTPEIFDNSSHSYGNRNPRYIGPSWRL